MMPRAYCFDTTVGASLSLIDAILTRDVVSWSRSMGDKSVPTRARLMRDVLVRQHWL
jgi:hypothetical protein